MTTIGDVITDVNVGDTIGIDVAWAVDEPLAEDAGRRTRVEDIERQAVDTRAIGAERPAGGQPRLERLP